MAGQDEAAENASGNHRYIHSEMIVIGMITFFMSAPSALAASVKVAMTKRYRQDLASIVLLVMNLRSFFM